MHIISIFTAILKKTPLWFWPLFAYILWLGIQSTKHRQVAIWRMFLVSGVLFSLKISSFLKLNITNILVLFCIGLVSITISYYLHKKTKLQLVPNQQMTVYAPGSYLILFISLSYLATRYVFGFLQAQRPEIYAQYSFLEYALITIFSGYILGKALAYAVIYKKMERTQK